MPLVQKIKKINEILPGWVKVPFTPLLRSKLIKNKTFLKQYYDLIEQDQMNAEDLQIVQDKKLKETLIFAYNNSEYYKRIMDQANISLDSDSFEILGKLPILTKKQLKENLDRIQVPTIKNFYTVTTGGTTGEPTKVYMANDAIYKEWAFVYHYWSKYGYDFKKSKLATFRGVNLGKKLYDINPLYKEIRMNVFTMNKNNIVKYVNTIDKYGADFLYGYPSAVYNYCRLAQEAGVTPKKRYKAVFLISENLYTFQKEKIEEILASPIAMFYGHSERAVFAERDDVGYSFNPCYGITEINEKGEPVVTGFINNKTPLIRYAVDDHVEHIADKEVGAFEKGLANGRYRISGHWDSEVLYGKKGEHISAAEINVHDGTFVGIESYQFIQREKGLCELCLVSETKLSEGSLKKIENAINKKLGGAVECKVKQVENVILSNRGKYKQIIQLCETAVRI